MTAASRWPWLEPMILLLGAGIAIGLIFPFGKLAADHGISPLVFAGSSAAGASLVLAALTLFTGQRIVVDRRTVRYAAIAGQITFAIPFGTLFFVIPHIGSAVPSILQSLTPIGTVALVFLIGLERLPPRRLVGLVLGVAGALAIILTRGAVAGEENAGVGWYVLAFATPIALSTGNVFRTRYWPSGHGPLPLATLTMVSAAIGLVAGAATMMATGLLADPLAGVASGWPLILAQSLSTGFGYAFFFRLQQVGGPVYLSQIGYLNTAVGVAFALAFFGETLSSWTWLAVAMILSAVALVNSTVVRR
jgi:drug/metabolite transporter (DMT)-like permease